MPAMVEITNAEKTYKGGFQALKGVNLEIREGEILALLGPNGAGKTTLISTICGITMPTGGTIRVGGHDVVTEFRKARALIGLVPQELTLEPFETVWSAVRFSRGLFGAAPDEAYLDDLLKRLSLFDKKHSQLQELSGGMKRRVLIAKALSHDPKVLFLDEPTAGVDVELRRDMWEIVSALKETGVTIILTTHYIEEAEAMADRIGVISDGQLLLVEETASLMARLGKKEMRISLAEPLTEVPASVSDYELTLEEDGALLIYTYDTRAERTGIARLVAALAEAGVVISDVETRQSSLEDIFVGLVRKNDKEDAA
ncbi:ABC-2 type transport system ATP-binding protein [Roseivivax halotolerans]|uniref:ABC-2 type transport system ATP-binding protein n=1 Tax=Roseivivax halotolerans TaxID=93684 RepID=A0A1I5UN19_9RHOB|nr:MULTISPECIES: ABC transporter ATP-binding protein [Roseivivax]QFT64517.1 Daunorubicin/doxorubicin resistance ATP-binding protein DrrA [Roseivivax sp. THAF30]SFP95986.1 ABC-2 type transport system ATP-binding protein [Roseivivax halotolerans]